MLVFTSCLYGQLFITCFSRSALTAFQVSTQKKLKNTFYWRGRAQIQPKLSVICLFTQPLLLSAKVMVYLGKVSQLQQSVWTAVLSIIESHHGNIVVVKGYYCLLQAWVSSFPNWWRYDFPPGVQPFCGPGDPLTS